MNSGLLSEEDYALLMLADQLVDYKLADVLNRNGCANWTVCPECGVDDFTHVEGCSIGDSEA